MKYVNANNLLPKELLSAIQQHYQGGYLYIPKVNDSITKRQTDYKTELEKRNYRIYLKYLEGTSGKQLRKIYHLSESSIRRILLKEKRRYQKMEEMIAQILPLWGMEPKQIKQIYPSAWEINHSYILKSYDNQSQLERNSKITAILSRHNIPVAKTVLTKAGGNYIAHQNAYFLMTKKLPGNNISDRKDQTTAYKMGCAIAQLHGAFVKCETEIAFWDNSLLSEIKGWVRETLEDHEWQIIDHETYVKEAKPLSPA